MNLIGQPLDNNNTQQVYNVTLPWPLNNILATRIRLKYIHHNYPHPRSLSNTKNFSYEP